MSISLYVEKSDGDREELDNVSADIACEVYAKMDWGAEMRAIGAAQEAGQDAFFPEFGLADDAGYGLDAQRTLAISPVNPGTVSFRFGVQDRIWGLENYPASGTSALIRLFFDGNDEAIAALAKPPPIVAHELSGEEFRATVFPPPIGLDGNREPWHRLRLREYVSACIEKQHPPVSLDGVEIENFVGFNDPNDPSHEMQFVHLLFYFGDPETRLAVVVREAKDGTPERIVGHRLVGSGTDFYADSGATAENMETFGNDFAIRHQKDRMPAIQDPGGTDGEPAPR